MLKRVYVTNDTGDSLEISLKSPEKSGFLITDISGLGPVKATINTSDISSRDGVFFNSARKSSRNIVFTFKLIATESGKSIENVRFDSYTYFPVKKNIQLIFETDKATVYTTGYIEKNEPDIFSEKETISVSVICPDPFFRALNDQVTVFNGVSENFEFPYENEVGSGTDYGYIIQYTENNIAYTGSDEPGITIYMHFLATVTGAAIYNTKTKEFMKLDDDRITAIKGSSLSAGDDLVICTTKGHKLITLTSGGEVYNLLNALTKDSSWLSLDLGDNLFAYDATAGKYQTQLKVTNEILYEGI
jgi:predicted phage tail component-like protein